MPIILEHKGLNIPINNLKYNQSTQCRYNNIHNKIKLFQQVLFFFLHIFPHYEECRIFLYSLNPFTTVIPNLFINTNSLSLSVKKNKLHFIAVCFIIFNYITFCYLSANFSCNSSIGLSSISALFISSDATLISLSAAFTKAIC